MYSGPALPSSGGVPPSVPPLSALRAGSFRGLCRRQIRSLFSLCSRYFTQGKDIALLRQEELIFSFPFLIIIILLDLIGKMVKKG